MIVDITPSVIRSKENIRVHVSRVFEDIIGKKFINKNLELF
jgi:hypothetical protein